MYRWIAALLLCVWIAGLSGSPVVALGSGQPQGEIEQPEPIGDLTEIQEAPVPDVPEADEPESTWWRKTSGARWFKDSTHLAIG